MRMKRKTILKSVVLAALCFGVSGISQAANYETVLIGTEADKKVMGDAMENLVLYVQERHHNYGSF